MTSISAERIAAIEGRKDELQNAMSAPNLAPDEFVRLSKDYAEIEPVAAAAREVRRLRAELDVLTGMLEDPELKEMAAESWEERRVGQEGSSRGSPYHLKNNSHTSST